jgi:hypothetical protein
MLADMPNKWRAPRRNGNGIDDGQPAIAQPIEIVRPQDGGAAKIVAQHLGTFQSPMGNEIRQQTVLNSKRNVLPGAHFGLAVTQ